VCCSALQCPTVSCSVFQRVEVTIFERAVARRVAVCCSVLQRAAVCCSVLQSAAVSCTVSHSVTVTTSEAVDARCGAVCCAVQYVAVCCSVLQCVAICCSVLQLQYVAVTTCERAAVQYVTRALYSLNSSQKSPIFSQ